MTTTTIAYTTNTAELVRGTGGMATVDSVETSVGPRSGILRVPVDTPVQGTGWTLATDLRVDIEYGPSGVTAWSPAVDDYGHGASSFEAVRNLLLSLVDFRESLERRNLEGNLSEELSDLLTTLKLLLRNQ